MSSCHHSKHGFLLEVHVVSKEATKFNNLCTLVLVHVYIL